LVRHTECSFELVDCGNRAIRSACTLPSILAEPTRAFLSVLDRYTLADLLKHRNPLRAILLSTRPDPLWILQSCGPFWKSPTPGVSLTPPRT
jgi:Rrf2 family nitric oxide-sensitive transcriptional repressor